jgi:hypothetical protein
MIHHLSRLQNTKTFLRSLEDINQALKSGMKPKLTEEGTSGTYILKGGLDSARPLAIYKPIDEE